MKFKIKQESISKNHLNRNSNREQKRHYWFRSFFKWLTECPGNYSKLNLNLISKYSLFTHQSVLFKKCMKQHQNNALRNTYPYTSMKQISVKTFESIAMITFSFALSWVECIRKVLHKRENEVHTEAFYLLKVSHVLCCYNFR